MKVTRSVFWTLSACAAVLTSCCGEATCERGIELPAVSRVKIDDPFWSPRYEVWSQVTACDVFDKFEGHPTNPGETKNVFENFDKVARGDRNTGKHTGLPWFDGLVYESIRGVADLLAARPDPEMEARIDGYIARIAAAQASEPDGYIDTYTQLVENGHRWGENGGFLRYQHDVYNAGMLVEAGVHYYRATGKTELLKVATRMADCMVRYMGPAPKKNVVPAHSGPEEALVKLYRVYRDEPALKQKVGIAVNERDYLDLAEFWIESRGDNCGEPLWAAWGNDSAERWIRANRYADARFGDHSRPSWGDYAQDSVSVFEQRTIEGHAVRATLLAAGIAAAALENGSPEYEAAAARLWDNMAGRRMFVTGGVGAVHFDEKFGPDYFLPTGAYLETCAAVGVGFFSQRMNQLTGDAKYMDEFERALYNNILTGVALDGCHYTYQNPLNADRHERWEWHPCPCCPPMFLKLVSAVPGFIYAWRGDEIFVNLFIGSETELPVGDGNSVRLRQQTRYPWDGRIVLAVDPAEEDDFTLRIRIPGWARGAENPGGLYRSDLQTGWTLAVNGEPLSVTPEKGYAVVRRTWKSGDSVELTLPMEPRRIRADEKVADLRDRVALASGPVIYCLEDCADESLAECTLPLGEPLRLGDAPAGLQGVRTIEGLVRDAQGAGKPFAAVPYYALGNRRAGSPYEVWIPCRGE